MVLAVSGEIDLDTADELRGAIIDAFCHAGTEVRVDLHAVSFLNSSGLNALIAGVHEAEDHSVRYSVVRPQPQVRKVMDMVGLTEILHVPHS
ncbi:MAG: STAS domain-containing protein [Sciscionella sp.]